MTALNIIVIANYPLEKHCILASLVKGEVLSPKKIRATTGGIASPPPFAPHQPFQNRTIPCFALSHLPPLSKVRCCRPKKFGRLPEGLPHLHRLALQHPLPKPHHPLLYTITLASLVKGEVLSPEKIRATTGGIASSPPPRLTTPSSKTALSLALHYHPCL